MPHRAYFVTIIVTLASSILLEHSVCRATSIDILDTKNEGSADSEILNTECQRVPLEVNFARDLGWDWLIKPLSLDIGRCVGICANWQYRNSTHAQFERLLGLEVTPCCVPTAFKSQEVLLSLNGFFSIELLENVKVVQCGCI